MWLVREPGFFEHHGDFDSVRRRQGIELDAAGILGWPLLRDRKRGQVSQKEPRARDMVERMARPAGGQVATFQANVSPAPSGATRSAPNGRSDGGCQGSRLSVIFSRLRGKR